MNFFITIATLLCALHSSPNVNNTVILSIGVSNVSHVVVNSIESSLLANFSAGFSRTDSKNRVSGFGISSFIDNNKNLIDDESIRNKKLFGLRVFSFIDFPVGSIYLGVRSLFDLGFSKHNFIFGPTAAYSFSIGKANLNINYFRGYSDFINFSKFTDSVEARLAIPIKGKDK